MRGRHEPLSSNFQRPVGSRYQYSNRQTPPELEIALTSTKSEISMFLIASKMRFLQGENAQFQCIPARFLDRETGAVPYARRVQDWAHFGALVRAGYRYVRLSLRG